MGWQFTSPVTVGLSQYRGAYDWYTSDLTSTVQTVYITSWVQWTNQSYGRYVGVAVSNGSGWENFASKYISSYTGSGSWTDIIGTSKSYSYTRTGSDYSVVCNAGYYVGDANGNNNENGYSNLPEGRYPNGSITIAHIAAPAAPGKPTIAGSVGATVINWTAASTTNAPVTGYYVQKIVSGSASTIATIPFGTNTYKDTTTTAGTTVTYRVLAYNAYTTSSNPGDTSVTYLTTPNAVGSLALSIAGATNNATATWTAPTTDTWRPVTGYRVQWYTNGAWQTETTQTALTATLSAAVTGNVRVRVRAYNSIGNSSYATSSTVVAIAVPQTRGTPTLAFDKSTRQMSATWTIPTATATTPVTSQTVEWQINAGSWTATTGIAAATKTATKAVNFGNTVMFRVKAVNAFGSSAYATSAVFQVPQAAIGYLNGIMVGAYLNGVKVGGYLNGVKV